MGARLILDREALRVGDAVSTTISRLIDSADYILFIASDRSRSSRWAHMELKEALRRGKQVLPVLTSEGALPPELIDLYYADFTADPQRGFSELVKAMRSD